MPRPGPRRVYTPVRLDPELVTWLEAQADGSGNNLSEEVRAQLHARKAALERSAKRKATAP